MESIFHADFLKDCYTKGGTQLGPIHHTPTRDMSEGQVMSKDMPHVHILTKLRIFYII